MNASGERASACEVALKKSQRYSPTLFSVRTTLQVQSTELWCRFFVRKAGLHGATSAVGEIQRACEKESLRSL